MGKSFVLKDASGRPQGYLMQNADCVRCRIDAAADAEVTLLFENDTSDTYSVKTQAQEQSWMHSGSRLKGAFVLEDGSVTLATDDRARRCATLRLCASMQHKEHQQHASVQQAAPSEKQTEALEKQTEALEKQECRSFPQRRWPPPPCMPLAVYKDGRWMQME